MPRRSASLLKRQRTVGNSRWRRSNPASLLVFPPSCKDTQNDAKRNRSGYRNPPTQVKKRSFAMHSASNIRLGRLRGCEATHHNLAAQDTYHMTTLSVSNFVSCRISCSDLREDCEGLTLPNITEQYFLHSRGFCISFNLLSANANEALDGYQNIGAQTDQK